MLHIILLILKIIGILLLVSLLLILAVTAAVVFVPVRYRVDGKKDGDGLLIKAEAFWFLHLLRVKAVYPEPGRTEVKLLCFTLYDSDIEKETEEEPEKKKKEKRKKEEKAGEKGKERKKEKGEKTEKETVFQKEVSEKTDGGEKDLQGRSAQKGSVRADEAGKETDGAGNGQAIEERVEQEETEKDEGVFEAAINAIADFLEKIKDILRKIKKAVTNIWYTIKHLCDKIVKIWENIGYYIGVFGEDETKKAFLVCRQELYKIWKNIRPSKCRAELLLGTGEPDTTGYILAAHGILYPVIGNAIIIEPDFENQVVEGKFFLKGRITVFVLLHAVIKIYFDKNIRYFLKRFKREEI